MRYKLLIRLVDAEEELEVASLTEAAASLQAYRVNNDVRASEWLGAEVYDNGVPVSRLAYNGMEIE